MSLHTQNPNSIPEETARVAHAAFPHCNTYMRMRDHFGALFLDDAFELLFPTRGQPAGAPASMGHDAPSRPRNSPRMVSSA